MKKLFTLFIAIIFSLTIPVVAFCQPAPHPGHQPDMHTTHQPPVREYHYYNNGIRCYYVLVPVLHRVCERTYTPHYQPAPRPMPPKHTPHREAHNPKNAPHHPGRH